MTQYVSFYLFEMTQYVSFYSFQITHIVEFIYFKSVIDSSLLNITAYTHQYVHVVETDFKIILSP